MLGLQSKSQETNESTCLVRRQHNDSANKDPLQREKTQRSLVIASFTSDSSYQNSPASVRKKQLFFFALPCFFLSFIPPIKQRCLLRSNKSFCQSTFDSSRCLFFLFCFLVAFLLPLCCHCNGNQLSRQAMGRQQQP